MISEWSHSYVYLLACEISDTAEPWIFIMSNRDLHNKACNLKFAVRQLSDEDLAGYDNKSSDPPFPKTPQENVFDPDNDYALKFSKCSCSYINVQQGISGNSAKWSGQGMYVSRTFSNKTCDGIR